MARRPHSRLGTAYAPTAQPSTIPASVGGVNTLDALMMMPAQDCIYTYNLMPVERGLRLRKGYREWANGTGGAIFTSDVRTILNYESQIQDSARDRLWAVNADGIYNVTSFSETAPTEDVTFSVNSGAAGYGVKSEFTNDASDHYMFYADALNGIHQYKEGTGWSIPSGWTYDIGAGSVAFPVADVTFVMVHKQRIWVILEDSDDAWYLPVASISGELQKFTFGAKMSHGGDLMGLWTWSVDGGAGVDDMLVAVGRGGDCIVYQGSDPSLNDFGSIGSWFVGAVPNSRRLVASHGSEMYILSTFGITSLRDLLQGAASNDLRTSPSAKINKLLRSAVAANTTSSEWALNIHPADGFLQVVTPDSGNGTYIQFNQNLSTKAWGMWEGVPIISADTWNGEYYMGGAGGVVYQYYGEYDADMLSGTPVKEPVAYRILTSFQASGDHSSFKRVGFVRTISVSSPVASFTAVPVYDYDESQTLAASPVVVVDSSSVWDTAAWDTDIWGNLASAYDFPKGALGMGRTFAIGMRGSANVRIEVIGWDVSYTQGGFL